VNFPARIIQPDSPEYPPALRRLAATRELYVRGTLPRGRSLAVVGTRIACDEAIRFTGELVSALAPHRIAIWSGGAKGIDAAAHRAAIAFGLPTVVVFGGGIDRIYPAEHAALYDEVLEAGGALVARVPPHVPPQSQGFLARNTILAAIADATLVIEAPFKSGARTTAAAARKLKKPIFVVPHAPWDPLGTGCALELANGARPITGPDDLLGALGLPRAPASPALAPARAEEPLDPDEALVLQVLDGEAIHLDLVAERAGLGAARATAALLTLTIKAVVVEGPAGSYRRASSSLQSTDPRCGPPRNLPLFPAI
jgi:DNA processing protein